MKKLILKIAFTALFAIFTFSISYFPSVSVSVFRLSYADVEIKCPTIHQNWGRCHKLKVTLDSSGNPITFCNYTGITLDYCSSPTNPN